MSVRSDAVKHVWWVERDKLGLASQSESDQNKDYVSIGVSGTNNVTIHGVLRDTEFTTDVAGQVTAVNPTIGTMNPASGANVSGYWGSQDRDYSPSATSGSGTGLVVTIESHTGSGPLIKAIKSAGVGYAINDTVTFTDVVGYSGANHTGVWTISDISEYSQKPNIPEDFHECLAHYAIAKGYEMNPEGLNQAVYFRQLFKDEIREAKKYANAGRVGSGYDIMGSDF